MRFGLRGKLGQSFFPIFLIDFFCWERVNFFHHLTHSDHNKFWYLEMGIFLIMQPYEIKWLYWNFEYLKYREPYSFIFDVTVA